MCGSRAGGRRAGLSSKVPSLPSRRAELLTRLLERGLLCLHGMRGNTIIGLGALIVMAGCGGGGEDDAAGLYVSGEVRDFVTGAAVPGTASVSTTGLEPAPAVEVGGAEYLLSGVTSHSVFYVLAGAAPTHRSTYGEAIVVDEEDRNDVTVSAVSEAYLAELTDAFGVEPTASTGVLLARVVDDEGLGLAGIEAAAFAVPDGAVGPFFLDAELVPAPAAVETSASGWAVFFQVSPGLVGLVADGTSGVTMEMPLSPVSPSAVTVATVEVSDGGLALPSNVSFETDVRPIFDRRGCENCHSGSGPGRDLGNLTLDGSSSLIHRELTEEEAVTTNPKRVDLAAPEASLVLTMPTAEDPPDRHPNITFTGPFDPDYLTILVWIREGALDN